MISKIIFKCIHKRVEHKDLHTKSIKSFSALDNYEFAFFFSYYVRVEALMLLFISQSYLYYKPLVDQRSELSCF